MSSQPLQSSSLNGHYISPIWQAAIDKYYEELRRGGVKGPTTDQDLWSVRTPDDLLQQIQDLAPIDSQSSGSWVRSLRRLEPIILNLNDFAAVITLALGMNGQVAAVIWGSIRLILKFAQPVLPELLDMFEELGRALPRFRRYEQELPMTPTLEDALLNTYTEIIVFCAHSIAFFRNNPNINQSRHAWTKFSSNFSKDISNLRHYSRLVDEKADMIRLSRETKTADTVEAIRNLQISKQREINLPCYMVPYGLNVRFFGRTAETDILKRSLCPRDNCESMKVMAIYRTGGVGKTQLALHYANTSMNIYDVVIWIPAENQIKMTQALARFAAKLGLPQAESSEDDYQSVQNVRDWLNTSGKTFLLIFDNVEHHDLLDQLWPASSKGSVIITCRSHSLALKRTTEVVHLQCFAAEVGIDVLYSLTGIQPSNKADLDAAKQLLELLGSLPLAMVQISEFMTDRGYSYEELLRLYYKSAKKIFARTGAPMQYEHTLGTVWDVSFERLSPKAKTLLNILTFFDPDLIQETILSNKRAGIIDPALGFLFDDFDFGDAVIDLTKASLVSRLTTHKAISIHRLVQFMVFSRLSPDETSIFFAHAVKMLSCSFPNTWNERTHQQGHSWASWETCSTILPHVSWLIKLSQTHSLSIADEELFAELVFRAGTYLWEKEQPTTARSFFEFGLQLDIKPSTSNYAQAYRLLGHIALDMARPNLALSAYQKALEVREMLEGLNSPSVADVYDSIACSYTEQGNVNDAFKYLSKSAEIHNARNPLLMGRTQAIYAMTYLQTGMPEKALAALDHCWKLQNLTEEQVIQSRYPKHSGDIILLSRIKYVQGLKQEAQQLASRTITIRRGLFGDKGPRVADSTFIVARMLEAGNEDILAAKLLRAVAEMSKGVPEMQGHFARSLWFLAMVEDKIGDKTMAEQLRIDAKKERDKITGRETADSDTDDSFMKLVPWMLW